MMHNLNLYIGIIPSIIHLIKYLYIWPLMMNNDVTNIKELYSHIILNSCHRVIRISEHQHGSTLFKRRRNQLLLLLKLFFYVVTNPLEKKKKNSFYILYIFMYMQKVSWTWGCAASREGPAGHSPRELHLKKLSPLGAYIRSMFFITTAHTWPNIYIGRKERPLTELE